MIADGTALVNAFDNVPDGGDRVLMLTGTISDYGGISISFATNAEVAVIGDGSQLLTNDSLNPVISNGGESIVYFANVSIGGNVLGDGLACSGSSVWLDDSEIRNNDSVGLTVSGGCAAHLRRSVVTGNDDGGIDAAGGDLQMLNSAVVQNGNEITSLFGGLRVNGAEIDISYSTIIANSSSISERTLFCIGGETGSIRNSILVSSNAPTISECDGELAFENNAADAMTLDGDNSFIESAFDTAWFNNLGMGNFRLSDLGRDVFEDIAMWQDGDPLTDIDGDPISMEAPSFPGYDQPTP